ncbi:MAG: hypothetical protein NXY57DRAFT_964275 [Lentinula lateritia]|uniref:Uncharacterized protein n=1 Tax=Lentinula lateritia TaxID=40482 RepID=A0ABQ8VGZ5_9AGAR|nr:MAG: hypothetical protein NXY57DRAFT_964275 [Lentinula lateritia]KAJ4494214.1 hypothetical protein C8R41DRAFT_830318 [Lentinula lateritia]
MPRLSSTIAVAIIAFTAIGAVDASSLTTADERVYSRHFARHHPAPRASNKHDVAVAGLETIGKTAVAGAELQGASTSESQRRSNPDESESMPPPKNVGSRSLHQRHHLGKAVKLLEHAEKATEGAAAVGTAADGAESAKDSNEGRSLDHEYVSLGKRKKPKKAKSKPKHEKSKSEPKQEEPKQEEPKPANEGTNKHDVAVAGFQAAGEAAAAVAGAQGSSDSTSDTSSP